MTTIDIDYDRAVDLLEQAVALKGEDHKARCYYINAVTGEPECIVGVALHLAGVSTVFLFHLVGRLRGLVSNGRLDGIVSFTPEALDVLHDAQQYQDAGDAWGNAVELAIERAISPIHPYATTGGTA